MERTLSGWLKGGGGGGLGVGAECPVSCLLSGDVVIAGSRGDTLKMDGGGAAGGKWMEERQHEHSQHAALLSSDRRLPMLCLVIIFEQIEQGWIVNKWLFFFFFS